MNRTSDELDYELIGDDLQAVIVTLDPGETVIAEAGAMMFMEDGIEMNTTLDPNKQGGGMLGKLFQASQPQTITLDGEEFSVVARPLSAEAAAAGQSAPKALVLRLRTDQIRFLREINTELAVTAVLGVLLVCVGALWWRFATGTRRWCARPCWRARPRGLSDLTSLRNT